MENVLRTAPVTEDNQYMDYRRCGSGSMDITVERSLGLLTDPMQCMSNIIWFEENDDFEIVTYEPDEISISFEDKTSNLALKQQEAGAGAIEWKKAVEVKAAFGSRYLQYIREFNANERMSGRDGNGILAMVNGGLWFKEDIIVNKGKVDEYKQSTIYGNMQSATWINPFSGNITAETVYAMEYMIVDFPIYESYGVLPIGWATPKGSEPIKVEYTSVEFVDTMLTLKGLNLTDNNTPALHDITIEKPIKIEVYDVDGTLLISGDFIGDGTDAILTFDFSTYENVILSVNYYLSKTLIVGVKVQTQQKAAVLNETVK
jgi:hypothetical protein